VHGEEIIGMGNALCHAGTAWLGQLVVRPSHRGHGVGRAIIEALLQHIEARGCTAVSLSTPPDHVLLFQRFGFVPVSGYVRYTGGTSEQPTHPGTTVFEPQHTLGLLRLDQLASGEDRRVLLLEHSYAGQVHVRKGHVLGYYLPLLGEGLIVASDAFVGAELMRWHLVNGPTLVVPEENAAAIAHLVEGGYSAQERVVRMQRGTPVPWRPQLVFGRINAHLG
jgi:Acetyltransferase (GNAT) family/Acetyltransferase (GNAT) domain